MRSLVTGATGLIGNAVARRLLDGGHAVRALVRDPDSARAVLPRAIELARGDVTDPASLTGAVDGAEWVFHCAGLPEQWQRDEGVFDRVNRQGTRNVLDAALRSGARRVVVTSTMDVFAAPTGGTVVEGPLASAKTTSYERSKVAAEREAEEVRARGLEVVFVNPAAAYGPGPARVALNLFILKLLRGQVPMLPPGGLAIAYAEGIADAHLAAVERGRDGERYLVADEYVTLADVARELRRQAGTRVPPTGPAWLIEAVARGSAPLARWLGFTPLIAPGDLSFLLWQARVDAAKAKRDLGFRPTRLADGIARMLAHLRSNVLATA